MLPFVPFTVFTFIPTDKPCPLPRFFSKSEFMVSMASASFLSISIWAYSGSSPTSTKLKYPDAVQVFISREEASERLQSTMARFMFFISMLTANGNTNIISTGNATAILGSPGSLKNCLNSFSKRNNHVINRPSYNLVLKSLVLTARKNSVISNSITYSSII